MSTPAGSTTHAARRSARRPLKGNDPKATRHSIVRRLASNFAVLSAAEVLCRASSVVVTVALMTRLRAEGFGRVEFAFNVVFWLVLIVRDCFETIVTREIARHPRLTRKLVDRILAVKLVLAVAIFAVLTAVGCAAFSNPLDRNVLILYGFLLLTTALGLDFVFRGSEAMGLVALSLLLRTSIYCAGVWVTVRGPSQILRVPAWLALGEFTGIALVWVVYARSFGLPRPTLGWRFVAVFVRRGRSVGLIHLCQAVIVSADLMVVGLGSPWSEVGEYGASHRLIAAVMAFALIFQQVIFPALSRGWRHSADACRRLMDFAVRVLVTGSLPVAVGGTLLAEPLVRFLLPEDYQSSGLLLAVGIWRAPVLGLAFLYQSCLIATNGESQGLRLLAWGSACSAPLIAVFRWRFGLVGASTAVVFVGLGLVVAGYQCLRARRCQPSAGHHLWRPALASLAMAPAAILGARAHVLAGVLAGAVTYLLVLKMLGGLNFEVAELAAPRPPRGGV
jgi:O-antigen/teichoic acid export membrane protein